MRKIKTMADVERVRRRNNIILGVVMIALLVGSSLGYSLMSADGDSESVVSEEGFDFVRDGGMWKLAIGDEVFGFQNLPSEVSDIVVDSDAQLGMYNGQPLYFVNPGEGVNEILGNIGGYILRYQESCFLQDSNNEDLGDFSNVTLGDEENSTSTQGIPSASGRTNTDEHGQVDCKGDLPVKDCGSNLIVFENGNDTRVYSEGNCVFIVGDVVRGSDAFLYKLLGVTK